MNDAHAAPVFCHLNAKTEYSLLDGSLKISALLDKLASLSHTYAALSDYGSMFGAVEFYQECHKRNIQPIIGCTLYCTPSPMVSEFFERFSASLNHLPASFHLTLLAKNHAGYKRLIRLVSAAYEDNLQDDIPLCSHKLLTKHLGTGPCDDLIAIASGHMGEIAYLLNLKCSPLFSGLHMSQPSHKQPTPRRIGASYRPDNVSDMYTHLCDIIPKTLESYKTLFAKDHIYMELVDNALGYEQVLHKEITELAQAYDIGCVATAHSYYLHKDDSASHLMMVAAKNTLTEREIGKRRNDVLFHLPNNEEFLERFSAYPSAIQNSLDIARRCKVTLDFETTHLPSFIPGNKNKEDSLLQELSKAGLKKRLAEDILAAGGRIGNSESSYEDRLVYELQVIMKMGFSGYFLIVQDFINWAKEKGIAVGPGRGSGAGSLVAYALGITDIDPLRWGLIFERFLNPERVSLPDFDVDFCQWRREEVINYVVEKYSAEKVAHIGTFGRFQPKAALKNAARVLGVSFVKMNRLTKVFPPDIGLSLKEVLEKTPELQSAIQGDELIAQAVSMAYKLEGMVSHTSVHPAGIVIADQPITDYIPTFQTSRDTYKMSQFEMKTLEQVGLVKFDFLGLKTLSVIDRACAYLCTTEEPDFDLARISLEDDGVYGYLGEGRTAGIFQAESKGMTTLCQKMKPSCFADIIALVALFRPGPLGSGMVDDYIERKHLRQAITYLHPLLEPILAETYGMILYQEQVQKIAATLANYSLGEADLLRRAMGKKIPKQMQQQKERFTSGCVEKGIAKETAIKIFELMAEFANYGFNKSHSAAYGLIMYQTAFLKFHYPWAFMMGIMTCDKDNHQKIRHYIDECARMNILVIPPCINASFQEFSANENKDIIYAFTALKGFGTKTAANLVRERQARGTFKSLLDLAHRMDLSVFGKKYLEILVVGGAMDVFGFPRKALFKALPELVKYSQYYHEKKTSGQQNLFSMAMNSQPSTSVYMEKALPWYNALQETKHLKKLYDIEDLIEEKKLLSSYLSSHPMSFYEAERLFLAPQDSLKTISVRCEKARAYASDELILVAFLAEQYHKTTHNQSHISYLRLEDEYTSLESVAFDKTIKACKFWPLKSGSFVYIRGYIPKGERRSLVITSIEPLASKLAKKVKCLVFEVFSAIESSQAHQASHKDWDESFLHKLKVYAETYPGDIPIHAVWDFLDVRLSWDLNLYCSVEKYQEFQNLCANLPQNMHQTFVAENLAENISLRENFQDSNSPKS